MPRRGKKGSTSCTRRQPGTRNPCRGQGLPSQPVQNAPRTMKFREALFFLAKFARMRDEATPRSPGRMLHVQHFVEQHVFDSELRHARTIHAAVQQDVLWTWVVAAELPAPCALAPANVRSPQLSCKIFYVQAGQ